MESLKALLILGPTGSGKTPLGEHLAREGFRGRGCVHLDFGERLRGVADTGRLPPGLPASALEVIRVSLATGALLEAEHVFIAEAVLREAVREAEDRGAGWLVLNGLPRHAGQAERVDACVTVGQVLVLDCDPETVLARIADNAGGDRAGRRDDDAAFVRRKLEIFESRTAPLVAHYRRRGARISRVRVDKQTDPPQILARIGSETRAR
jgi:adenylate kinase family enzyme